MSVKRGRPGLTLLEVLVSVSIAGVLVVAATALVRAASGAAARELAPQIPTKSGLMVGLGETDEEILEVMRDMRAHNIEMLTIGQYLAPSNSHLPVRRYVHPDTFKMFEAKAYEMGFSHAAVGAMVRSSYHADQQAHSAHMSLADKA